MIVINGTPLSLTGRFGEFPENSPERKILDILIHSDKTYKYGSEEELLFELRLRREIIRAAAELMNSGISFETFRKSFANEAFWDRDPDGGFSLRAGVAPAAAVKDIFKNGSQYGTECATAIMILYYKALAEVLPEDVFNRAFPKIRLMNWHDIDRLLREAGYSVDAADPLPGDRRYFANPEVNPETPEWQGENVIDMGDGTFAGHGIGRYKTETFIRDLNQNRRPGAERSAYLMDSVGRPDFKRLYTLLPKEYEASAQALSA